MILRILCTLAALFTHVLADVEFTTPPAGGSLTGLTMEIDWKDSGKTPKIADLANYQLFLCAGGNDATDYVQLATLVTTGDFTTGNSVTVTLSSSSIGGNTANAYFLMMISAATGGTVVNFSDRFSLPGQTGVFPAAVITGLKSVTGTAGPATQNNVVSPQNPAAGAADGTAAAGAYGTPYTMQAGSIRYAPMPPMAATTITAKNAAPQFPTSAYTVYKTAQGAPNAITTNTQALTFSVSSRENTAAAAGQPTDAAMQKFLERWKD